MELPYFDGSHKVWPRFKSIYIETTKAGGFSELENLNRLQKYLKGDALKAVSALLIDQRNVNAIITKLEEHFGKPEVIYSGLIRELMAIRNPRIESPKTMIEFRTALDSLVINMEMLGQQEYLNDPRLVMELAAKLTPQLGQRWISYKLDKQAAATEEQPFRPLTLEDFNNWLKPQEDLARMMLAEASEKSEKPERQHCVRTNTPKENSTKATKCFACLHVEFGKMTRFVKNKSGMFLLCKSSVPKRTEMLYKRMWERWMHVETSSTITQTTKN